MGNCFTTILEKESCYAIQEHEISDSRRPTVRGQCSLRFGYTSRWTCSDRGEAC